MTGRVSEFFRKPLTKILRATILWGALLACVAVAAPAQARNDQAAGAVPANVASVVSGGHWSRGGAEGFYRAVVTESGVEHVDQSLFVQWIGVDADTGFYSVVSSVPVTELDAGHSQGRIIEVNARQGEADVTFGFSATVTGEHTGSSEVYVIVPAQHPGVYDQRTAP